MTNLFFLPEIPTPFQMQIIKKIFCDDLELDIPISIGDFEYIIRNKSVEDYLCNKKQFKEILIYSFNRIMTGSDNTIICKQIYDMQFYNEVIIPIIKDYLNQ